MFQPVLRQLTAYALILTILALLLSATAGLSPASAASTLPVEEPGEEPGSPPAFRIDPALPAQLQVTAKTSTSCAGLIHGQRTSPL